MKKRILALLLSLSLLSFAMAGCSNSSSMELQSFSVRYSDFETNLINNAHTINKATSRINVDSDHKTRDLHRIIVSTPGIEDTTFTCLVQDSTDQLFNLNVTGFLTPYFEDYIELTLQSLSINLSTEDLVSQLAIPDDTNQSYEKVVESQNHSFSYQQSEHTQSLTIRPLKAS